MRACEGMDNTGYAQGGPTGWTVAFVEFIGRRRVSGEFLRLGDESLSYQEVKQKFSRKLWEEAQYDAEHDEWPNLNRQSFEPGVHRRFFAVVPKFSYSRDKVQAARKRRAEAQAALWVAPKHIKPFSDLPGTLRVRIFFCANGCWLWVGQIDTGGYGRISFDGTKWVAHRLVYSLLAGDIPKGALLRHSCDNRMCVSPHHLSLGTIYDNNADAKARGKDLHSPRRQSQLGATLYWEDRRIPLREIREIRILYFTNQSTIYKLAKKFDLSRATVSRIVNFCTPITGEERSRKFLG